MSSERGKKKGQGLLTTVFREFLLGRIPLGLGYSKMVGTRSNPSHFEVVTLQPAVLHLAHGTNIVTFLKNLKINYGQSCPHC